MKSADMFSGSEHQSDLQLSSGRLNLSLRQSYLGAWFETLKHSAHYTQMSRTGLFQTEAGYQTYLLFGPVESLNFEQWWLDRGRQTFGRGEFPLTPDCLVQYQAEQDVFKLTFCYSARAYAGSSRLHGAFELARCACGRLLSAQPVIWPFFKSRVSPAAVFRSLDVVRACVSVGRQGRVKLYEIGERLNLNRSATGQPGDRGLVLSDKHVAMGKLVSAERRRGLMLTMNAARGIFPSYSSDVRA
jgi:hypothetical protein